MKRHLPWMLSSFRSSKRRIPYVYHHHHQEQQTSSQSVVLAMDSSDSATTDTECYYDCEDDHNHMELDHPSQQIEVARCSQFDEHSPRHSLDSFDSLHSLHSLKATIVQVNTSSSSSSGGVEEDVHHPKHFPGGNASSSSDKEGMRHIEVLHHDLPTTTDHLQHHKTTLSFPTILPEMRTLPMDMQLAGTPTSPSPATTANNTKVNYIIEELISTEKTYVRELQSIVEHYLRPFEEAELSDASALIPAHLRGQSELLFGNLRELAQFHSAVVLNGMLTSRESVSELCHILVRNRSTFLNLYRPYCQNKPLSEALRGEQTDQCKFFVDCQRRAGHLLPLSSYLLKPIQRVTKYQLLMKELLRFVGDTHRREVQASLASMLDLLAQINADMQQLHILGYVGDLRQLGPLRLQTECELFPFKRKSRRATTKAQRRHLFLFDGGVLIAKKRVQPVQHAPEYYEHKLCIPTAQLGFAECSKQAERFEVWDEHKSEGWAVYVANERDRAKWIQRLARLTVLQAAAVSAEAAAAASLAAESDGREKTRPQSWTSEGSSATSTASATLSSRSSASGSATTAEEFMSTSIEAGFIPPAADRNGNIPVTATAEEGPPFQQSVRRKSSSEREAITPGQCRTPTLQQPGQGHGHVTNIQIPQSRSSIVLGGGGVGAVKAAR